QSVTANTQTTVVQQKAKPLVKPTSIKPTTKVVGKTYQAMSRQIESAGQVDFAAMAKQEALEPSHDIPSEIKSINPPKGDRPAHHFGAEISPVVAAALAKTQPAPNAPPASATGSSPETGKASCREEGELARWTEGQIV